MPDANQFVALLGGAHQPRRHESAHKHVAGEAAYSDDLPEPPGTLHIALGLSERAHARVVEVDLAAVMAAPGVARVFTVADVPGVNDISSTGRHDDPVFASGWVEFHGQVLFAVAAHSRLAARRAVKLARISYQDLPFIADIEAGLAEQRLVTPGMVMQRGDATAALAGAPRRIKGVMHGGGQEHFYLEGQVSLAIPGEDDEIRLFSSTQHPSETQHLIAHVLGLANHAVTVETRRMGGAFGGKETQANQTAAIAALVAFVMKRPAKLRLDRDEDMITTGKRHDCRIDYEVGFDDHGRILGVAMQVAMRCGYSADLSGPVSDRALFHADNAYFYPDVKLSSLPL